MSSQERAEFVDAYTHVLITAWSSEEFAGRLDSDPAAALREVGFQLPADATVELVRTIPEGAHDASLDVQVEAWEQGLRTGHYKLHIPDTPQVELSELTEGDLDSIAAGTDESCCCCCPCCCCSSSGGEQGPILA
jgi:hypothetical protein